MNDYKLPKQNILVHDWLPHPVEYICIVQILAETHNGECQKVKWKLIKLEISCYFIQVVKIYTHKTM